MNVQALETLPPHSSVPVSAVALTPMDLLNRALSQGAGMEVIEKFVSLQERWEKNQARKSFDNAISDAKSEIPTIKKNRHVGFESKKQGSARTDYKHEDLAEIARTVDPILSKHGLSYRWRTKSIPNEPVTVTCIVSHRDGYSEENTLSAGRDDTGNKNSIQAIGSTITYLQRYTLKAALGLAASNDDDGEASQDVETIDSEKLMALETLITESGANKAQFLKLMQVESIAEITPAIYPVALGFLETKKAQKAGAKQ